MPKAYLDIYTNIEVHNRLRFIIRPVQIALSWKIIKF